MKITSNWQSIPFDKILEIYESVGWTKYTEKPDTLLQAFQNSTLVLIALDEDVPIGALRSISDLVSIHYLQDILIAPTHQKMGIGRRLLSEALHHFSDVRTHILLTDDEEKQALFYQSLGYINTKDTQKYKLNAFVQMKGLTLE